MNVKDDLMQELEANSTHSDFIPFIANSTHSDFIPFITCPECSFSRVVWLYNADRWLCVICKHEWKDRFEMDDNDQQAYIRNLRHELAQYKSKVDELLAQSARQNKRLSAAEAERDQLRDACKAMVDAKLTLWDEASRAPKLCHIINRIVSLMPWEKVNTAIAQAEGTPHAPSPV
jgi:ferredoxin